MQPYFVTPFGDCCHLFGKAVGVLAWHIKGRGDLGLVKEVKQAKQSHAGAKSALLQLGQTGGAAARAPKQRHVAIDVD